jgi:hypothetical protein
LSLNFFEPEVDQRLDTAERRPINPRLNPRIDPPTSAAVDIAKDTKGAALVSQVNDTRTLRRQLAQLP